MSEKERKSFIVPPTEVKNYDIVKNRQQDIYDLEDCIELFESLVDELQSSTRKNERTTVRSTQLMAKYVYMEDSIMEGLEKLPKLATSKEMQQRLIEAIQKFNKCCSDFQDSWGEELWLAYEATRNPKKGNSEFQQVKSHHQINRQLLDLQDIAITLTRLSRGNTCENLDSKDPFALVDEEALKFKEPALNEKSKSTQCEICVIN